MPRTTSVIGTPETMVHLGGPASGAGARLLLFAPLSGTVFCYDELVRCLGDGASVHGVQAEGLDGRREPLRRVEAMASRCAEVIHATWPGDHGVLVLAGWSFGALVAVETALRLRRRQVRVDLVAVLDNLALVGKADLDDAGAAALLAHDLGRWRGVDLGLGRQDLLPLETTGRAALLSRRAQAAGLSPGGLEELLRVYEARGRAQRAHARKRNHSPCGGRVLALVSEHSAGAFPQDPTLGWGARCTGELEVVRVPGDHHSMLQQPHAAVCAGHLEAALGAAAGP